MSKFKVDENGLPLPCSIEGCERPLYILKFTLCRAHDERRRRYGDPCGGPKYVDPLTSDACSKQDCSREVTKHTVSRLCNTCYNEKQANKVKQYTCTAEMCNKPQKAKKLCAGHLDRFNTKGVIGGPLKEAKEHPEGLKLCGACETAKSLEEFSISKNGYKGRYAYCKSCAKVKKKQWRSVPENAEKDRQYRIANLSKVREQYLENRDSILERERKRYRKNPEPYKTNANKRRAIRQNVKAEDVSRDLLREMYGDNCPICGVILSFENGAWHSPNCATLEHLKPLSKGGEHTYQNIVLFCRHCNNVKHNKDLLQFLMYIKAVGGISCPIQK